MRAKKPASRIRSLFSGGIAGESTFEDLEDLLIESDVGVQAAMEVVDELRNDGEIRKAGRDELIRRLKTLLSGYVMENRIELTRGDLNVFLVLGVNGVGKTTAIARIARFFGRELSPEKIVLCAGDTFRAGAIEQLAIHGERLGVRVVRQNQGADAGAVIYDGLKSAGSKGVELLLADTAGRMHNKANLMRELQKMDRIVRNHIGSGTYHKLLVIDVTTGQNGLRQAEVFHEAVGIDSLFLAKYDSAGKGGIAIAVSRSLGIPVSFIGTGENYDDIVRFRTEDYLDSLLTESAES